MRIARWVFLLAIGLAASFGAEAERGGNLVDFPNLADHAPSKLLGYPARPDSGSSALLGSHSERAGPLPVPECWYSWRYQLSALAAVSCGASVCPYRALQCRVCSMAGAARAVDTRMAIRLSLLHAAQIPKTARQRNHANAAVADRVAFSRPIVNRSSICRESRERRSGGYGFEAD
jgi:hypothetical protein